MNNKVDIQFKGLTTSPSDYACSDGELAMCHNMVARGGEMAPFLAPDALPELSDRIGSMDGTPLIVHRGNGYKHLLFYTEGAIRYFDLIEDYDVAGSGKVIDYTSDELPKAEVIGNIVVFVNSEGMRYARWSATGYSDLGNNLPPLPSISFGLVYNPDAAEQHTAEVGDGFQALSNAVYGALNGAEAAANKDGLFCYPFFVRYAYRLYDGSHVMPSAPMLMIPINDSRQIVRVSEGTLRKAFSALRPMKLYYRVAKETYLGAWQDLIEGVDIFVTRPFRPHETRKEVSTTQTSGLYPTHTMGVHNVCSTRDGKLFPDEIELDGFQVREVPFDQENKYAVFALRDFTELYEDGTFYHVGSIPNDALSFSTEAKKAPIDYYALDTLTARPTLSDEYLSHQRVIPESVLNYNSRLVASNIKRELYRGQSVASYFPPCGLNMSYGPGDNEMEMGVSIVKNGVEYFTVMYDDFCMDIKRLMDINEGDDRYDATDLGSRPLFYFYFPDPDAKSVTINISNRDRGMLATTELRLKRHPILGGAYWFGGLSRDDHAVFKGGSSWLEESVSIQVHQRSSLYMSEVNNPFYFPAGYTTSVGSGTILRVEATTRPLSEGQFGEFPLMAFTDEGIWAISINSEGRASARQPISRAVLSHRDAVCNLDNALAFISNDGVNILEGSRVTNISAGLVNSFFSPSVLPSFSTVAAEYGLLAFMPCNRFADYMQNAMIAYSSKFGRIYVQRFNTSLTFVYDISSGAWTTVTMPYFSDVIEDYPNTLLFDDNCAAYNLNSEGTKPPVTTILTRPLALGAPDIPKTVHEGMVRGRFESVATEVVDLPTPLNMPFPGWNQQTPSDPVPAPTHTVYVDDVKQVLYGSNDLQHWFVVNSSVGRHLSGRVGSPYKYFRLLVFTEGSIDNYRECLSGASFDVQPRLNNTLR